MNERRRSSASGIALVFILAVFTMALAGCFMPLNKPNIVVVVEPAYNDDQILIPYTVWDSGTTAQGRWTLYLLETETLTWIEVQSQEVRLPNGTSGVLEIGGLEEARYELVFELLATRDRSYEAVPHLTQRHEFVVDRTPPPTPAKETITYYEGGVLVETPLPAFLDYVEAEIPAPAYNPDRESPTVILARIGDATPPLIEDAQPERFALWNPGDGDPPSTLYYVAIDEAGNRGNLEIVTFP